MDIFPIGFLESEFLTRRNEMSKNLSIDWKKVQSSLADAAKISGQELKRNLSQAKVKINGMMLIQKRKERLAELGRFFYEAAHSEKDQSEEIKKLFEETECQDILKEIKELDHKLLEIKKSA
jgi:ABC-type enterochelin transport system ATPase subunit